MEQQRQVAMFKTYLVTAPFQRSNSGDGDYIDGIVQLFEDRSNYWYITLDGWPRKGEFHASNLIMDRRKGTPTKPFLESLRRDAVAYILALIEEDDTDRPKVLNLQLRPPDNGTLFSPDDLRMFRAKGITVVITCHEYKLNSILAGGEVSTLNTYSQSLFTEADGVMFFNQQDLDLAIVDCPREYEQESLRNRCCLTPLCTALTLRAPGPAPIEPDQRPHNILMFGLMRSGKGFDQVIEIGKRIIGRGIRVIVAGGIVEEDIIAKQLQGCCSPEFLRENFRKFRPPLKDIIALIKYLKIHPDINFSIKGDKLPVDFYFNIPRHEVPALFAQAKYFLGYDDIKGFAVNASSIQAAIAYGSIVIANIGECTPVDVPKGVMFATSPLSLLEKILTITPKDCEVIYASQTGYFNTYLHPDIVKERILENFIPAIELSIVENLLARLPEGYRDVGRQLILEFRPKNNLTYLEYLYQLQQIVGDEQLVPPIPLAAIKTAIVTVAFGHNILLKDLLSRLPFEDIALALQFINEAQHKSGLEQSEYLQRLCTVLDENYLGMAKASVSLYDIRRTILAVALDQHSPVKKAPIPEWAVKHRIMFPPEAPGAVDPSRDADKEIAQIRMGGNGTDV